MRYLSIIFFVCLNGLLTELYKENILVDIVPTMQQGRTLYKVASPLFILLVIVFLVIRHGNVCHLQVNMFQFLAELSKGKSISG